VSLFLQMTDLEVAHAREIVVLKVRAIVAVFLSIRLSHIFVIPFAHVIACAAQQRRIQEGAWGGGDGTCVCKPI
jgi:hypothetical protein